VPNYKSDYLIVKSAFRFLSGKDRFKIVAVVVCQFILGILDLIGVALIGMIGTLTVNGIQSKDPTPRISQILDFFRLNTFTFQQQVGILGVFSVSFLLIRTFVSVGLIKRTLTFLSSRGADLGERLIKGILTQPFVDLQKIGFQTPVFSVTHGTSIIMVGIIGAGVGIASDVILLSVLSAGLFLLSPAVAIQALVLYFGLGLTLYFVMHKKVKNLGEEDTRLSIASSTRIFEAISAYRENFVHARQHYYAENISELRHDLARVQAKVAFLPSTSKYIIESSVLVGSMLICAIQFALFDASQAISTLAVFIAAGSRIAPAILRLQQYALQIKTSLGSSKTTLDLLQTLSSDKDPQIQRNELSIDHSGFEPVVRLQDVSFSYNDSDVPILNRVSFEIKRGEFIAIVGPSGSGKTSLADLILGVLNPIEGSVEVSGKSPKDAVNEWPGAISYVPQEVFILRGSILENVSIGYPTPKLEDLNVKEAIQLSQLSRYIDDLPEGVQTLLLERGANLSGGQRQRIGIARALYTRPQLLILDEATSALDGQTERDFSEALNALKGERTVIAIAHRLSTVIAADKVIYLAEGKIQAMGSFNVVRTLVPDFDEQAKLMGL
jgi:ATP-binding cassette, subfamily B, bacterial PglK